MPPCAATSWGDADMSPPRGRFIVLEGGEGAGKSTQARRIDAWLRARGRQSWLTREPGGTPLAEAIRELVLKRWDEGMPRETETLLIYAARAAHIVNEIGRRLAFDIDVVCDRFIDSSYAYQGVGRQVPTAILDTLSQWVSKGLKPDLVLVFDLDPEIGLARASARGIGNNRFEEESLSFARNVRQTFLDRAATEPGRYALIDAAADEATVWAQVESVLEARL